MAFWPPHWPWPEFPLMSLRRLSLTPAFLLVLAGVLGLILAGISRGVMAQSGHVHQCTTQYPVYPSTGSYFYVGANYPSDYQPMPGCLVSLTRTSVDMDNDECQNTAPYPNQCTYPYRIVPNNMVVKNWSDNGAGGQFGYLNSSNTFVSTTTWANVTHYKAPSTTGTVNLKLTLTDVTTAVDPVTHATFSTTGGEDSTDTKTLNVAYGPAGSWSTSPTMTGGTISAPNAGAFASWVESVPCSATGGSDSDTRNNGGSLCPTSVVSDPVSYTWSASGGQFYSPLTGTTPTASGPTTTWIAPAVNGTYTLYLTTDDAGILPAGDSGLRNDGTVVATRTITVQQATWAPGTAIDPGSPAGIMPFDRTQVRGSETLACKAYTATDNDQRTAADGTVSTQPDEIVYTWTASAGSFVGGNTGQNVTWQAPPTGGGLATITLTLDDKAQLPPFEAGNRNDVNVPPLTYTRTVYYHTHEFSTTGNTADQIITLKHRDGSDASGGVYAGETLTLGKGAITPDVDTCTVPYCPFSVSTCTAAPSSATPTTVTEDTARHQTVGFGDMGGGTFGKLDTDGYTLIPLDPTSQASQITHYRVNKTLIGGIIQVWAKVQAPGIAIDPFYTAQCGPGDVNTAMDPVKECTHATAPVSFPNLAQALYRGLSGDNACGCPSCGENGFSTIDPRTGGVGFDIPLSGYQYRGVDLGISLHYNSKSKADPSKDSPDLPDVDATGDLAHMSQRNSRWTHSWAQRMEVVYDGSEYHALWYTGGGVVSFLGIDNLNGTFSWVASDNYHALVSGGTTPQVVRVKATHASTESGGSGTVPDERLVERDLPYAWFEARDGAGTLYRFDSPVSQRGLGAALAYFPLRKTTDRWGRGVKLAWSNGYLDNVEAYTKGNTPGSEVLSGKKLLFVYANNVLESVTDAQGGFHDLTTGLVNDETGTPRRKLTGLLVDGPAGTSQKWVFDYGAGNNAVDINSYYHGFYTGDLVIRKTEPDLKQVHYAYGPVNLNRDAPGDWDGVLDHEWYFDNGVNKTIAWTGGTAPKLTYPGGVVREYHYDSGHNLSKVVENPDQLPQRYIWYTYDTFHNLTGYGTSMDTAPLVSYEYTIDPVTQRITKVKATDINLHVTETSLGFYNLPVSLVESRGGVDPYSNITPQLYDKRTTWEYDELTAPLLGQKNNLTAVKYWAGNALAGQWGTDPLHFQSYGYAATDYRPDLPTSITELVNRISTLDYGVDGSLAIATSPQNLVASAGSPDAVPSKQILSYYTSGVNVGLPSAVKDPLGRTIGLTYSVVTVGTGPVNYLQVTTTRLTGGGSITPWDGASSSMLLDWEGKLLSSTDERGVVTEYTYNGDGQLLQVLENATGPLGEQRKTQYQYNLAGNLTKMTPPNGDMWSVLYDYNRFDQNGQSLTPYEGRLTHITHKDGTQEFFGYNQAGELLWESRPYGPAPQAFKTITYHRDNLHRVYQVDYPSSPQAGGAAAFTLTTRYDEYGRVNSVARDGFVTSYTYDGLDRLTQVLPGDGRQGLQIAYTADTTNGRWIVRKTLMSSQKYWDEYEDTKGRLDGIYSSYGQRFGLDYDLAGRPVARKYSQSLDEQVEPLWTDVSYEYFDSLRQTRITHWNRPATTTSSINQFTYLYDSAGRLTSETDKNGTVHAYGYDNLNRLRQETHPDLGAGGISYDYDLNGNRTVVTQGTTKDWYQVDFADKLLWINRGSTNPGAPNSGQTKPYTLYQYDDFGQLTQRDRVATSGATKKVFKFFWDTDGRLANATRGANEVFRATYAPDGERVKKWDSESGPEHVYNYGLHDTNGDVFFTPGFGHQAGSGSPARKYHADAQGSTRYLTNKAGDAVSSSFRYDAYGQRTALGGTSSDTYPTEYQYAGAYGYQTEPTTGDGLDLQYLYQRYYDPQAGRFITRDPIRWAGGTNLYGYVDNNPVTRVDPTGLTYSRGWSTRPKSWLQQLWDRQPKSPQEAISNAATNLSILSELIIRGMGVNLPPGPTANDAAKSFLEATSGSERIKYFRSFSDLKRNLGDAGPGNVWHHIVEQGNVRRCDYTADVVHNTANVVRIPRWANQELADFFSSKRSFTNGMRVREWIREADFATQFQFGQDVLQRVLAGLPLPR